MPKSSSRKSKGAPRGGFGGGGTQNMLARAQQLREEMLAAQAEVAEMTATGEAGAGRVKATVNGAGVLLEVKIDPEVVVKDEVDLLEDLIIAAVADATEKMTVITQERMGPYASMIQGI